MDMNAFLPPDAMVWLTRYGLFAAVCAFSAVVIALVMRPFWLWYSGRTEELDHLKRIEAATNKSLLELEILNQTLSIPIKKAAQKSKANEGNESSAKTEQPLVVSEATKADFLKALEKSRTRIMEQKPD